MVLHSNYNTIIVPGIQSSRDTATDADRTNRRHTVQRHERIMLNVSFKSIQMCWITRTQHENTLIYNKPQYVAKMSRIICGKPPHLYENLFVLTSTKHHLDAINFKCNSFTPFKNTQRLLQYLGCLYSWCQMSKARKKKTSCKSIKPFPLTTCSESHTYQPFTGHTVNVSSPKLGIKLCYG